MWGRTNPKCSRCSPSEELNSERLREKIKFAVGQSSSRTHDLQTAIRYVDGLRSWWNLQAESTNGMNFAIGREKNGNTSTLIPPATQVNADCSVFFFLFFKAQNPFAVRAKAMLIFFKNHSLANKLPI